MKQAITFSLVLLSHFTGISHNREETSFFIKKDILEVEVTVTVYNPVESQCDSDPLITADMSVIDLNKLKRGDIKWVALSRNLLKRWGGKFNYGDTIKITGNKQIEGIYYIHDTMDERFVNYVDILSHPDEKIFKFDKLKIIKL